MSDALEVIRFDEARKIWSKFARHSSANAFSFELEVHKKMLNIFQAGDCYYYIFNLASAQIEFVSDSVKNVLQVLQPEDFTLDYVLNHIHPDDIKIVLEFEQTGGNFYNQLPAEKIFQYKVSYDYRMAKTNGQYIRILQQVVPIQGDGEGGILRTLCMHTDISHLKKDLVMSISMLGLEGEPSYYNIHTVNPQAHRSASLFTKAERQILALLLEGKTSQQIADTLCISKLTVNTHRRNMLQKTGASSIAELTLKYLQGNLH